MAYLYFHISVGASGIIVGTAVLGATALAGLGAIAPIGIGVGGFGE